MYSPFWFFSPVEDFEMRSTNDLIAAANAQVETDEFEKLKAEREKERLERQKQKFVRQISATPGAENVVPVVATTVIPNPSASTAEAQNVQPTSGSNANLLFISEPVTQSTTQKWNEGGLNE